MPYFKDIRESLLMGHGLNHIDLTEYCILTDFYKSKNPDMLHGTYSSFDLENLSDDECRVNFRFKKDHIYDLQEALDIPIEFLCYNNVTIDSLEALCIMLKRFAFPCRYSELVPLFARPIPQLSIICNQITDFSFDRWHHLLNNLNQNWLSPANLQEFSNAVYNKCDAVENCWGFVDGTVKAICKPKVNQGVVYNGHKRVHAIKFQCVVTPSGMIANLYGPVEERRHDSGMLAMSGLLPQLERFSRDPNGNVLCVYGDCAYPLRPQLLTPFPGIILPRNHEDWNKAMSEVRVSVEWVFGEVVNYFKFIDFKKDLKIGLSSIGNIYTVCAILHNARTIFYSSISESYFGVSPPALGQYFS